MSVKQTICCDTCGDELRTPFLSLQVTVHADTDLFYGSVEFCSMACLGKWIRERAPTLPELPANPQAKLDQAAQGA